jgi:hypothetical protein
MAKTCLFDGPNFCARFSRCSPRSRRRSHAPSIESRRTNSGGARNGCRATESSAQNRAFPRVSLGRPNRHGKESPQVALVTGLIIGAPLIVSRLVDRCTPAVQVVVMICFIIRAIERKARDSNPHSRWGNRVSSAARPTVSGYLPDSVLEWTTGESNPDLLVAGQASFRWTSSPFLLKTSRGPPENRTRSPYLQGRDASGALADQFAPNMNPIGSSRRESNPRFLFVREVSLPLDHGTVNSVRHRVARVGVEPTDIGLSTRSLCQFAYRAILSLHSCRTDLRARDSNHGLRTYETRPSTSPPAMSQAPVSNRASRPYESQADTCHAWEQ